MTLRGIDRLKGLMRRDRLPYVIVAAVIILVVSISMIQSLIKTSSIDAAQPTAAVETVGELEQTWTTSYAETTCSDWNSLMDDHQRYVAAADILTSARNKIDGGTGLPPESMISEFRRGITTVCVVPSMTLLEATYGLYTTEPRFHP
ncbi:hypothetical protein SAMN06295879_1025 [Agreia bicolorata]|uniref:Uncharacterized protein n=1 Tax=Agreia bicolorata TaxID=110935 RepID=A0A1T4XC17_9MICO|nr:hypothetical protein [Agreia bicolorata]SKA87063.1 hypothetical protein SAMN06295879_1025 [Agreia bicolorata]